VADGEEICGDAGEEVGEREGKLEDKDLRGF